MATQETMTELSFSLVLRDSAGEISVLPISIPANSPEEAAQKFGGTLDNLTGELSFPLPIRNKIESLAKGLGLRCFDGSEIFTLQKNDKPVLGGFCRLGDLLPGVVAVMIRGD